MSKSQTPNFKWLVPNDDELVRDGADAIRVLGTGIDTTLKGIDNRAKPDLATKAWVGSQSFATTAYSRSLNRWGIGTGTGGDGAKIIVGTHVTTTGNYSLVYVPYPSGVGFSNVYSVTVCNGDSAALPFTVAVVTSGVAGFWGVLHSAVADNAAFPVGQPFKPGLAVRLNYCAVGV